MCRISNTPLFQATKLPHQRHLVNYRYPCLLGEEAKAGQWHDIHEGLYFVEADCYQSQSWAHIVVLSAVLAQDLILVVWNVLNAF